MSNFFDTDFFQWLVLIVLLLVSTVTLGHVISSGQYLRRLIRLEGKVDGLQDVNLKIFSKLLERLGHKNDKDDSGPIDLGHLQ